MALTITIANETFTLDENGGLQNGPDGTPVGSPRDDSDVAASTLPTAFADYLFGTDPGELGLDNSFPTDVGVAASSSTLIHVTSGSPVATLGFTDADGNAFDGTQSSGFFTDGGQEIFLMSSPDGQTVLGMYDSGDVDPDLDSVAFAVYMQTDGTLGTDEYAQLWSVTFVALANPVAGDDTTDNAFDDAVDLLQNVYIHATGALDIKFDNMPSSANLFNDAAENASGGGIFVFGRDVDVSGSGKYTNASDTIHTSQGGDGATIGVNNQMFDPGEGAYFTFVTDIDDRYLSGLKNGLSSTEADYQQNMLYDSLIDSRGASVRISQTQGNNAAGMTITAYDLASSYQGSQLIAHSGENQVDIDKVYVWDSTHTNLLESYTLGGPGDDGVSGTIDIAVTDGVASLTGLDDGMIVEWHTVSDHNQVLIEDTAGAWDLGGFGITQGAESTESLAGVAYVEDDHPSFTAPISDGAVDYSGGDSDTHTLNEDGGTDGIASSAITYFTPSVELLAGVNLIGVDTNGDGQQIQYILDANNNGSIDSAETLVCYTMELTPAGSYTFSVNNAPAAPPLVFDFDSLPSGSNLFGSVAKDPDGAGIFVFGEDTDLSGASKYTNASDTIKTSQGGIGATIGVDNQMFDAGDGAFFTFVDDIDNNFLSGVSGGLTATEADYGNNLRYVDGLHETSGAFIGVSQIQAGSTASMAITAFLIDPNTAPQGVDLINASGQTGDAVSIFSASVYQGSVDPLNLIETTDSSGADAGMNADITVTIDSNGVAHVEGLDPGMVVAWSVDDPSTLGIEQHNQALIVAEAGKFDVGFFGFSEAQQVEPQTLDFTVTVTDGDGDHISDAFQVDVNVA